MQVYQAIVTKYIGPTNTRGSRIKATAAAGSIFMPRDDSLSIEKNHAKAAQLLADKYGWPGRWFQGGSPNECDYCFVSCEDGVPAFATVRQPA